MHAADRCADHPQPFDRNAMMHDPAAVTPLNP
jgi:hypothetical protein